MKTILYIGGFELPDKNAAAQRVLGNSAVFKDLGYEVIFLGVSKEKEDLENFKLVNNFKYYERLYPQNNVQWLSYLTNIKETIEIIKKHKIIDYLICYNYPAIALWRLKIYCNKNNIKIIADTTEWYEAKGNIFYKILKNTDTFLRMRIIQEKLDGIIVISNYLAKFYKKRNKNILNLPALVNLNDIKWKNLSDITEKEFIKLIYAGSTEKGKDELNKIINLVFFSNVFYKNKIKFFIIGLTKEEYLKKFNILNFDNRLLKNIIFMGKISHQIVLSEISSSDFFIFFRENNLVCKAGFPTKFSESISCGTPVITNKTSNIEDYLIENKNGFFIDIDNKSKAIKKLQYIFSLNKIKINIMKKYCKESRIMNYSNFLEVTKDFFSKL